MKKYATVEIEKSTRIFISALTWFLRRTVPSSRNANPACIARTMMAPSRMNRTSEDVFRLSMCPPPWFLLDRFGNGRGQQAAEILAHELLGDLDLFPVEDGVELLPLVARFLEEGTMLID